MTEYYAFSIEDAEESIYHYLKEAAYCEERARKMGVFWWVGLGFIFDPHHKIEKDWVNIAEMYRNTARYVADRMDPNHRWSKK